MPLAYSLRLMRLQEEAGVESFKRLRKQLDHPEMPSVVESCAVCPAVEQDYRNRRSSLEASAFGQHLDLPSPAHFDERILSYFLFLFSQKMTAADGFKTLAMIGHF